MSAVSSAASLPIAPITMPTSAAASAGASLTPSPTIAMAPCASRRFSIAATLSAGSWPDRTSSTPSSRSDGARRRLVIAGDHRDARHALRAQVGHHSAGIGFRPIGAHRARRSARRCGPRRSATCPFVTTRVAQGRRCRASSRRARRTAAACRTRRRRPGPVPRRPAPAAPGRLRALEAPRREHRAARHDRGGNRMFRLRFDRRGKREQFIAAASRRPGARHRASSDRS